MDDLPTFEEDFDSASEDLGTSFIAQLAETVVTATDWTTETIVRQLQRGNIELNPKFQRRDAWKPERKSQFIESLFLGIPIPQIVLAERHHERGRYIVIDGKQRLLSLAQFFAPDKSEFERLKLRGLQLKPFLNDLTLSDLEQDNLLGQELNAFLNQTIRTVVVKNWPGEDFLYLLFLRLNRETLPLSPQELRQALHPGEFVSFADDFSTDCKPLMRALNISKPDFRMRDVELVVRYFAFRNFIGRYSGNLKTFLDDTCDRFNKGWDTEELQIAGQAADLSRAIDTTFEVFGEYAFRKWNGNGYERVFNRAVFDVMVHYFSLPNVCKAALKGKHEVQEAFTELCSSNNQFRSALETTTKSVEAVTLRFDGWRRGLQGALGIAVDHPTAIQW